MSKGVKAAYDAWAPKYDTDEPRCLRDLAAAVLRKQPFQPPGTCIVELGCGTGTNTVWLAERSERVVALDFSEPMLDEARRRVTSDRVRFVLHDISEPWPIPDRFADLIVASLVLGHVRDLRPVFQQTQKALKTDGTLFICELHPFQQLLGVKAQFVDRITGAVVQVPAFRHDVSDFVNNGLEGRASVLCLWTSGVTRSRLRVMRCQGLCR